MTKKSVAAVFRIARFVDTSGAALPSPASIANRGLRDQSGLVEPKFSANNHISDSSFHQQNTMFEARFFARKRLGVHIMLKTFDFDTVSRAA